MPDAHNPLANLSRQEILWLAGILKDACRERLEKNLVNQAIEERLYQRGPVEGRSDPRPFLRIWEPRYRKFLDAANALYAAIEAGEMKSVTETLRAHVDGAPVVRRHGPAAAKSIRKDGVRLPRTAESRRS